MEAFAYFSLASRFLLAATFLAAAVGKATNFSEFVTTVRALGVPLPISRPASLMLTALEAGLGIVFAAGIWPVRAAASAAVLLVIFVVAAIVAIVTGITVSCNCFGRSMTLLGPQTVLRSILLGVPVTLYSLTPETGIVLTPSTAVVTWTLVLAGMLLASWGLTTPSLMRLIRDRRSSERHAGEVRVEQSD